MRLQNIYSYVTLKGVPKTSSNRQAKELQCLRRPTPRWHLPGAWGGWSQTICVFVNPITGLSGTKVSRSQGSSWVKWNLPQGLGLLPCPLVRLSQSAALHLKKFTGEVSRIQFLLDFIKLEQSQMTWNFSDITFSFLIFKQIMKLERW